MSGSAGSAGLSPDAEEHAFTDHGPWVVRLEDLVWRPELGRARAQSYRDAAALLRKRRLPPLGRLARVLAELTTALVPWYARDRGTPRSRAGLSRRLRRSFERLGPSYVKLGQIVSAFEGLFPDELVAEFEKLRDRVQPEPFTDIVALVERELGRPLHEVFSEFRSEPIAAASIAQVHAARLVSGEDVVVKVQRPHVGAMIRADVRVLAWLSRLLVGRIPVASLANPPAFVDVFARQVAEELDFRLEAENMLDLARVFAVTNQRTMVVPRPHPVLVTRKVLVMERLHGFAFDDVEAMHAAGIDTTSVLRAGLIACLEGAMIHGVFHGDLHGGNLLVQPSGRTVLFDFGITGRLGERQRIAFLRLMLTGTTGDLKGQLAAMRDLGAFPPDTDIDAVFRDLELDQPLPDPTQMSADEMVAQMAALIKKLLAYGAQAPKALMLFVKNLMFLNGATAKLAPELDMIGELVHIHQYFTQNFGEQLARDIGRDAIAQAPDVEAIKAGFMVGELEGDVFTFRELQDRRRLIMERMSKVRPRPRRRA